MGKFIDLTGQRFGRLTVIKKLGHRGKHILWLCVCDCGTERAVASTHLRSGHSQSCGCLQKEHTVASSKTHGMSNTRIYREYASMKRRCDNPNVQDYSHYGGRGITICEEWRNDFMAFYNWAMANGYRDDLTIDRIDFNGNYEPSNCRWATMKEQANNTRRNSFLEFNGETKTVKQWAEIVGIRYGTLVARLNDYGWSVEKALTTPVIKTTKNL